jgi:hypothetical protein
MKFKHQGKEYDMPVRKFKDQKSADNYSKAMDRALESKRAKDNKKWGITPKTTRLVPKKAGMTEEQMEHVKKGDLGSFMRTYMK